jgi:uncharacterized protein DUF1259
MRNRAAVSMLLFCITAHSSIKKNNSAIRMIDLNKIKKMAEIFNTKPEEFPEEGVIKVNFPRKDIAIAIAGNAMDPFMGFTSWISFQKGTKKEVEVMAMGDLVLLEHEVDAVMSMALNHDIKVTALHNHFFYEQPRIFFMHIEGEGNVQKLSISLKEILDARSQAKSPISRKLDKNCITGSTIEKIIGMKGQAKNGMFKIIIGRQIHAGCGCLVGKNMGINTWAAFAGSDSNAIVDGDFAVLEDELQSVLKILRDANISVVAIHNHMTHENPRMLFLHYLGYGKTIDLAQAIKNALDKTSALLDQLKKKCLNHVASTIDK